MTGLVTLIGGGWEQAAEAAVYGPFLDAAGTGARIACVVLDEGDGEAQFQRWADVLARTASCEPVPVLVPLGGVLRLDDLTSAAGVLVCGGLTPAYRTAI